MRELSCGQARALATDLLDGGLTPMEESQVRAHVATCATCPALYRSLVAVHAALGATPRESPPSGRLVHAIAALLDLGGSG